MSFEVAKFVTAHAELFHQLTAWDDDNTVNKVGSPLGSWLVLALLAGANPSNFTQENRDAIEASLGTTVGEAYSSAVDLLDSTPEELNAVAAAWVNYAHEGVSAEIRKWATYLKTTGVPVSETLPKQKELDEWASVNTNGLITEFPLEVNPDIIVLLASAVAVDISWKSEYETTAAPDSRWGVKKLLLSKGDTDFFFKDDAGLWAVHTAVSEGSTAVFSVIGPKGQTRAQVQAKAHEVAFEVLKGGDELSALGEVTIDSLPVGVTDFVKMSKIQNRTGVDETVAVLPAWEAETSFNLLDGTPLAFEDGANAVGYSDGDAIKVEQTAVASYSRKGFKAAAVTAFSMMRSASIPRVYQAHKAEITFNRPYAVVALSNDPKKPDSIWNGVPLFSAWIVAGSEPESD